MFGGRRACDKQTRDTFQSSCLTEVTLWESSNYSYGNAVTHAPSALFNDEQEIS